MQLLVAYPAALWWFLLQVVVLTSTGERVAYFLHEDGHKEEEAAVKVFFQPFLPIQLVIVQLLLKLV